MNPTVHSALVKSWISSIPRKRRESQQRRNIALERQHQRSVRHRCNYCGNTRDQNMQMCSSCKAAFYCDRKCQAADYQSAHKEQCKNFERPPITRAFITEPLGDGIEYPPDPVFAQGYNNGIGVWVSASGPMNCDLGQLIVPMRPPKGVSEMEARQDDRVDRDNLRKASEYKTYTLNLLTLQVLVQNRRRDKQPALIFGTRSVVIGSSHFTPNIMAGHLGSVEPVYRVNDRREPLIPIAYDPWTDGPRFIVKNFNGTDISDDASLPPAVLNKKQGIIKLNVGEYVIMNMQFRLGDGKETFKEWHALAFLPFFTIPLIAPWTADGQTTTPTLSNEMKLNQDVYANFNVNAIHDYYGDYIRLGKHAFIRSHYGRETAEEYAQEWSQKEKMMAETRDMMRSVFSSDPERRAEFLEHCRIGAIPPRVGQMFFPELRFED